MGGFWTIPAVYYVRVSERMKSTRGVMEAGAHPCDPLGEGKGIAPRGVEGVDRFQKQVIFPGPTPIHERKAEKKAKKAAVVQRRMDLSGKSWRGVSGAPAQWWEGKR